MAGKKALAIRFEKFDKARIKGKVGHTRTGACTAAGPLLSRAEEESMKALGDESRPFLLLITLLLFHLLWITELNCLGK